MSSASDDGGSTLATAVRLFNEGRYLAAHELFEELWASTEGPDSDFFKGLIQATICLHHLAEGNVEGAARLYAGHRRYLAGYLPSHLGVDVAGLLAGLQRFVRPVVRGEAPPPHAGTPPPDRPRIELSASGA